jgi:hypothetical protein
MEGVILTISLDYDFRHVKCKSRDLVLQTNKGGFQPASGFELNCRHLPFWWGEVLRQADVQEIFRACRLQC